MASEVVLQADAKLAEIISTLKERRTNLAIEVTTLINILHQGTDTLAIHQDDMEIMKINTKVQERRYRSDRGPHGSPNVSHINSPNLDKERSYREYHSPRRERNYNTSPRRERSPNEQFNSQRPASQTNRNVRFAESHEQQNLQENYQ